MQSGGEFAVHESRQLRVRGDSEEIDFSGLHLDTKTNIASQWDAFITVTFATWSDLNPRTIRAYHMSSGKDSGHSPDSENVQHRSPAEISKGHIASFTVDLQN